MKKLLITIPCYNEEAIMEKNIAKITAFAEQNLSDYDWRLLIIDNASSDRTHQIAQDLQKQDNRILATQCPQKGRGAALSKAWSEYAGHDIYSYMDIDLATDLKDYKTLLASVNDGNHIVAGSRYIDGADIKRSPKREFLSRVYNGLLQLFFRVNFKDAQCGFKAFHGPTLAALLPRVKDTGWFWDTELMIFAQKEGYKIKEIPVSWREIRDEIRKSKVSPFVEVARQLKNILNLRLRLRG